MSDPECLHTLRATRPKGQNQYGEPQPEWRDLRIVQLYEKKTYGPGYMQLAVRNAAQPPEMVAKVLKQRLEECKDGPAEEMALALRNCLEEDTWWHCASPVHHRRWNMFMLVDCFARLG